MGRRYVIIDLETTGLNPMVDRIIEIGMVVVENNQIVHTFSSLVNPHQELKPFIMKLTGISQEMVNHAPSIKDLENEIFSLLYGEYVLVGHNIKFDKAFIDQVFGELEPSLLLDTVELAQVAFPCENSYALENLCLNLNIELQDAHRACADATATAHLMIKCLAELQQKPHNLYLHIIEYLTGIITNNSIAIIHEICTLQLTSFPSEGIQPNLWKPTSTDKEVNLFHKQTHAESIPDMKNVASYFREQGLLEANMEEFEHRDEQEQMVNLVVEALLDCKHLVVEAGTGTGKSLAYLIPAILWSVSCDVKVVVATHTINLQEQLWQKDIPFLKEVLPFNFKAALVKGRNNYLCLRKFFNMHKNPLGSSAKYSLFHIYLLSWLTQTESGDKSELVLFGDRYEYWQKIMADSETCLGTKCSYFNKGCFLMRARAKCYEANVLVVNHSLLFADVKTENKVLPAFEGLIIDEAHHLEAGATHHLGYEISQGGLKKMLDMVWSSNYQGLGPGIVNIMKKRCDKVELILSQSDMDKFDGYLLELENIIFEAKSRMNNFWFLVEEFTNSRTKTEQAGTLRLTTSVTDSSYWQGVLSEANNLLFMLKSISDFLKRLVQLLDVYDENSLDESIKELQAVNHLIMSSIHNLDEIISPSDNLVSWIEWFFLGDNKLFVLKGAPLRVDGILYEHLFSKDIPVIMTSATLSVGGNFEYFRQRVGLNHHESDRVLECLVKSPFDYEKQSMLAVVTDLPHPGSVPDETFINQSQQILIDIISITEGRCLVLFTSNKMLNFAYQLLERPLNELGIRVHAHKITGGRSRIIQEFKANPKSVIFGTSSFWEGIDLPGDMLQQVIIVRLPFEAPNVPTIEARVEDLQAQGIDPFSKYSIPQAVVKFKQGFGRLIRTKRDKGVVVVLDARIVAKRYGKVFLKSLPIKRVEKGDSDFIRLKLRDFFTSPSEQVVNLKTFNNVDSILDFLSNGNNS